MDIIKQRHQLTESKGGYLCTACDKWFKTIPSKTCAGVPTYDDYASIPNHLASKTRLQRDHNLRLADGQAPVASLWSQIGAKHTPLYDIRQAVKPERKRWAKGRRYDVRILHDVYCTSSYNHYGAVVISGGGTTRRREYDFDGAGILRADGYGRFKGYPAYVYREAAQKFAEAHAQGKLRVYEYNRDEQKRYENLRYHDPDWFADKIKRMVADV